MRIHGSRASIPAVPTWPAVRRLAALVAGTALAVAACGGAAPETAVPSPSASGSIAPATAPIPPSIAPSVGPGTVAGITWTRLVGPPAWEYVAFERAAAGAGGLLAIGSLRGDHPAAVQAWWSPAGASWRDVSPKAEHPSWGNVPVAFPAGFAILGSIEDETTGQQTSVTWIATQAGTWAARPAVDDWIPRWAATPAARVLVVGGTAPVGGAPSGSWISGDFQAWQPVPFPAAGSVYIGGITTLADGRILAFGRETPQPVDVAPLPQGVVALWSNRDGLAWTPVDTGVAFVDADLVAMAAGATRVVAMGRLYPEGADPVAPAPTAFWWSDDGVAWTRATGPDDLTWEEAPLLLAVEDRFVLLGASGGMTRVLAVSPDGAAWRTPDPEVVLDGVIRDVVRSGDLVLGVGTGLENGEPGSGAMWFTVMSDG